MFKVIFALCVQVLCQPECHTHSQSLCFFELREMVCSSCRALDIPVFGAQGTCESHTQTVTCLLSGDKNRPYFSTGHLLQCCGTKAVVSEVMRYATYWLLRLSEGIVFLFFLIGRMTISNYIYTFILHFPFTQVFYNTTNNNNNTSCKKENP